ncbi:MAG: hypothetical protein M1358_01095 [Chloroflexi bacterium]|nr:hypothetical protein [Chloroflexota bacterium]
MPELPEIECLRRQLENTVVGKVIADAYCRQPKALNLPLAEFVARVSGKSIVEVRRRAKSAVLRLDDGSVWLHLGLRGQVVLSEQAEPLAEGVVGLRFRDGFQLALAKLFMGHAHYVAEEDFGREWNEPGVEPVDGVDLETFRAIINRRPNVPIKLVLMDQAVIAGIGNTYSDEILLSARIHPARPSRRLTSDEIERLYSAMKEVLARAIQVCGEPDFVNLEGGHGGYKLQIHGQETCGRCGGPVEKSSFHGRTGFFCPRCQGSE